MPKLTIDDIHAIGKAYQKHQKSKWSWFNFFHHSQHDDLAQQLQTTKSGNWQVLFATVAKAQDTDTYLVKLIVDKFNQQFGTKIRTTTLAGEKYAVSKLPQNLASELRTAYARAEGPEPIELQTLAAKL